MAKKKKKETVKKAGRPRIGVPEEIRDEIEGKLAAHLLSLFEQSGLTVEEFAEKVGIHKGTANDYFCGRVFPRIQKWERIAAAFNLPDLNSLLPHLPRK